MAGLNDDVDDGLDYPEGEAENYLGNSSIIDPPNTNPDQPTPDKITLIAGGTDSTDKKDEVEVTPEQLFGDGVIPGKLPNFNAEFVLVDEKTNRLTDINVLAETVKARNSISQEDANVLNNLIPGFLNENKPLEYFTRQPSKTQLSQSLKEIDKIIDSESTEIDKNIKNQLTLIIEQHDAILNKFDLETTKELLNQTAEIKDWLAKINNCDNTKISDTLKINDLLMIHFEEDDLLSYGLVPELEKDLTALKELFKDINLSSYIYSFESKSDGSLVPVYHKSGTMGLSLKWLIKINSNGSQELLPYNMCCEIRNNRAKLQHMLETYNLKIATVDDRKNFLSDINNELLNIIETFKHLFKLHFKMIEMNSLFISILIKLCNFINLE